MDREYEPLPIRELGAGAGFRRPTPSEPARVTLESPAVQAMTDLARVSPATIRAHAPLALANQLMITRGVRLLLVLEEYDTILGVITAGDILGERPLQVAASRGLRVSELAVADVMIAAAQVEVIAAAELQGARVGHVRETLRRLGRQHALVVDGENMVRGIFSMTQIARQLGLTLAPGGEVARTFSEIEAALAK